MPRNCEYCGLNRRRALWRGADHGSKWTWLCHGCFDYYIDHIWAKQQPDHVGNFVRNI